ncbi:MFS transporter [Bartonella sp. TP]|uniref:MFS transporter n=1 Tax=Bartonella sp. TP TaxID=3057550 RepID=UPI0025B072BF|nr:MFS transporter [Bartonella sp. TP]WJW80030.1 MFS transporter [Bartonella sp. TP]
MLTRLSTFKIVWIEELLTSLLYLVPYPLIVVYFYQNSILTTKTVALLLFTTSFTARVGRILLTPMLDKIAINKLLLLLQFMCFIGFAILATTHNISLLFIACLFIGLCYGNSILVIRTIVATLKSNKENDYTINFARLNIATNLPSLLGPFIFNQLYNLSSNIAFWVFSLVALLSSVWSFIYTKHIKIAKQTHWFVAFKEIVKEGKTQLIIILVIMVWLLYSFAMTLFPLFLVKLIGNAKFTWTFMTVNAAISVLFSVAIHKALIKLNLIEYRAILIAFLLFFCSIFCMLFLHINLWLVFIFTAIITLAEIIAIPACNTLLSKFVSEDKKVAIFAVYALCIGIGESIGSSLAFTTFKLLG